MFSCSYLYTIRHDVVFSKNRWDMFIQCFQIVTIECFADEWLGSNSRIVGRVNILLELRVWLQRPHRNRLLALYIAPWFHERPDMVRVTFPDYAPVLNFLNPDPGQQVFQIWESDSCSNSGNHWRNRNSAIFDLETWHFKDHADSWYCRPQKMNPDFHKILIADPNPGRNKKNSEFCRNRPRQFGSVSTSATYMTVAKNSQEFCHTDR